MKLVLKYVKNENLGNIFFSFSIHLISLFNDQNVEQEIKQK